LIEWATVNRGRIVAAILTLARGWIVAGGNVPHDLVTFGSFERWAQCMGGILHYAGVSGFLSNLESMYAEADVDTPEWEGFLSAWADNWGGRAVTGRQVIEFLQEDTLAAKELLAALPGFLGELDKGFTRRLGKALRGIKDRRFPSGLVLKKAGSQDRALRWRVVKEEGGTYRRMDAYGRWVASDTDAGLTDAERYYRDLGDTEEMPF